MRNSKLTNIVLYLSLGLVLIVCSFVILYYEISAYQKIDVGNQQVDDSHYPLMYLNNKMRGASSINVEDNKLIIGNEKTETIIYLYNGNLVELTTVKGYEIDESAGEKIFKLDDFSISSDNDLVKITYSVNEKETNVVYDIRSESNER